MGPSLANKKQGLNKFHNIAKKTYWAKRRNSPEK